MKLRMRITALVLMTILWIVPMAGFSEEMVVLTPILIEDQGGRMVYPRLDGHPDIMIQIAVNQKIVEELGIQPLLERITSPFAQLEGSYKAFLDHDILSIVFSASDGKTQRFTTVNIDLRTGEKISLHELFKDEEAAFQKMEEIIGEKIEPNLNSYLENGTVLPMPREVFALSDQGITFYYPMEQFGYFSGFCGSVNFAFYEIEEFLNKQNEGIPARLGALDFLSVQPNTKERIAASVESGALPQIAPQLGDDLFQWLEEYRQLSEPDFYPGGSLFQMEAGEMRDIWLLTDALTDDYSASKVQGIRADRVNLFGIQPGITEREMVLNCLGHPEQTVQLDAYRAMDYLLPAGVSDYYAFGDNMLRLHYNEEELLISVQLLE